MIYIVGKVQLFNFVLYFCFESHIQKRRWNLKNFLVSLFFKMRIKNFFKIATELAHFLFKNWCAYNLNHRISK